MTKYIFVTGGVVSGLGKGITAASLGTLFKSRGLKVFVQKLDPYLNVDPGTMSPYQHGEVFVTEDGAETDLDLGHYERFIDEEFSKLSNFTSGRIYSELLEKERKGEFLGETVQVVPHVTDAIKGHVFEATKAVKPDIQIIEIGGTVGDIESLPFLEAIRQIGLEKGFNNVKYIHTVLIPYLKASNELKTKPAQHSVKTLMGLGIIPDFLVLRADQNITDVIKEKISRLCTVKKDHVIAAETLDNIYEVPMHLYKQKMDELICKSFGFNEKIDLSKWKKILKNYDSFEKEVTIGLVGKYVELEDAYISVREALKHGGLDDKIKVNIAWINSEKDNVLKELKKVDGVLVPGGFGTRGISGKIEAIKYAREKKLPFLGICLGMQLAVIEYARNVIKLDADSTEFNSDTPNPIIDYLPDQYEGINYGGTMRLGAYECKFKKGTLAYSLYKKINISERHRHRYEFNNKYRDILEEKGMVISGVNPGSGLVEVIELKDHPYFIASQFHPEFKSRPTKPHPLFKGLINAALKNKEK